MTFRLIISAEKKVPGCIDWLLKNRLITYVFLFLSYNLYPALTLSDLLLLLRPCESSESSDASLGGLEDAAFLMAELLSEQKLEGVAALLLLII
jgi:hypothetical protein